jgi:hypothetical protein
MEHQYRTEEALMGDQIIPVEAEFTLLKRDLIKVKRRSRVRYRCNLATLGKVLFPGGEALEAWIHNLSEEGIGLNLSRPLDKGTPLTIRLGGLTDKVTLRLPAEVVHATQELDGSWRVGCQFAAKLPAEALDAML